MQDGKALVEVLERIVGGEVVVSSWDRRGARVRRCRQVFANRAAKTATTTEARRELLAEKQRVYADAIETLATLESLRRYTRGGPGQQT